MQRRISLDLSDRNLEIYGLRINRVANEEKMVSYRRILQASATQTTRELSEVEDI